MSIGPEQPEQTPEPPAPVPVAPSEPTPEQVESRRADALAESVHQLQESGEPIGQRGLTTIQPAAIRSGGLSRTEFRRLQKLMILETIARGGDLDDVCVGLAISRKHGEKLMKAAMVDGISEERSDELRAEHYHKHKRIHDLAIGKFHETGRNEFLVTAGDQIKATSKLLGLNRPEKHEVATTTHKSIVLEVVTNREQVARESQPLEPLAIEAIDHVIAAEAVTDVVAEVELPDGT